MRFIFLQSCACSPLCWVACSVLLVRMCPQLFGFKPWETPSGSVTSQKEHDEVFWCESVTHRRSKSLGCIYHLNFFTQLLKKKIAQLLIVSTGMSLELNLISNRSHVWRLRLSWERGHDWYDRPSVSVQNEHIRSL